MATSPTGSFYRHLIRNAWKVVRANPLLWIFGFFVSFLGNGGIYELLVQGTGRLGLQQDFGGLVALAYLVPNEADVWRILTGQGGIGLAAMVVILFLVAILACVVIWAVVSSQGALITGVRDAAKGGRRHTFASLFGLGREVFLPLLTLDVLSRMVITAFFYLLLSCLLVLIAQPSALLAIGYLLAFLILIPATIIIGFVTVYAACHLVLFRSRFVEAVENAIALFLQNWLLNLEAAALIFTINIVVSLVVGFALYILGVLALVVFGFTSAATGGMAWLVLLIGGTIGVVALALTGAGLAAFQYAVWVELFLKLNKPGHGAIAKLARWWHGVFGR
jgi:hypothetical protein